MISWSGLSPNFSVTSAISAFSPTMPIRSVADPDLGNVILCHLHLIHCAIQP
jgi:hypothetical protein